MSSSKVAVVGAGIAGLAAAELLQDSGFQVRVFESANQAGGRMRTLYGFDAPIDVGAKIINLTAHAEIVKLLGRHGLLSQLRPLRTANPFAVWRHGRLHPIGKGPAGMMSGSLLGWRGRSGALRLGFDVIRRHAHFDPDRPERSPLARLTVSDLATAYSAELHDSVLATVASGVFSIPSGSAGASVLVNQLVAARGAPGRGMFFLAGGMETLAQVLADKLNTLTAAPIDAIGEDGGEYWLLSEGKSHGPFQGVVSALPAPVLLNRAHPSLPSAIRRYCELSEYSCQVQVMLQYARDARLRLPPDVYGIAFAPVEDTGLAWVSQEDVKYGMRDRHRPAPTLHLALGAERSRSAFEAPDEAVVSEALSRLEACFPHASESLTRTEVIRLPHAMPTMGPAAMRTRRQFLSAAPARFEVAGDWSYAPSTEGAVRAGRRAAHRLAAALVTAPRGG